MNGERILGPGRDLGRFTPELTMWWADLLGALLFIASDIWELIKRALRRDDDGQ